MRDWMLVPLSILFLLAALELGLRVAGYNPLGIHAYSDRAALVQPAQREPKRIYEGVPLASGHAWGTDVQLNAYGLRDREYALEKPLGTRRIVVLGDSITFGNHIAQHETYVEQLEAIYAKKDAPVEVINLGFGGYDPLQEVATLADVGLQFQPDLVIVGFCVNDIGVASGNLDYILKLKTYGATPLYRLRLAQWVRVQVDRIQLGEALLAANKAEQFAKVYGDYSADVTNDPVLMAWRHQLNQFNHGEHAFSYSRLYGNTVNLGRIRYAFEQLGDMSKQQGFPVLVMLVPYLDDAPVKREAWQTAYRMIEHEALRMEFAVWNAYPAFQEYGFERLPRRRGDYIHPNPEGHRLMAEGLAGQIDSHNWLNQ